MGDGLGGDAGDVGGGGVVQALGEELLEALEVIQADAAGVLGADPALLELMDYPPDGEALVAEGAGQLDDVGVVMAGDHAQPVRGDVHPVGELPDPEAVAALAVEALAGALADLEQLRVGHQVDDAAEDHPGAGAVAGALALGRPDLGPSALDRPIDLAAHELVRPEQSLTPEDD